MNSTLPRPLWPQGFPACRAAPGVGCWLLAGLLSLAALLLLATTLVLLGLLDSAREGLTFVVDGQPRRLGSTGDWDIDGGTVLGAAQAALIVATVLLTVVPLMLLAVVLTAGLALAAGLGAVLLVLALVLLLLPVWGMALLLWLPLRKRARPMRAAAV